MIAGSGMALLDSDREVAATEASDAIIAEAMRDAVAPLYYCAGAGLTDLATAWLRRPEISKRMILVWIGGPDYSPAGLHELIFGGSEYNLTIDIRAPTYSDSLRASIPRECTKIVPVHE